MMNVTNFLLHLTLAFYISMPYYVEVRPMQDSKGQKVTGDNINTRADAQLYKRNFTNEKNRTIKRFVYFS